MWQTIINIIGALCLIAIGAIGMWTYQRVEHGVDEIAERGCPICPPARPCPAAVESDRTAVTATPVAQRSSTPARSRATWADVRHKAVARCNRLDDSYSIRSGCLQNEERAFRELAGSFGMPESVARKALQRCRLLDESFSIQWGCMQNEARGYQQIHGR